MAALDPSADKIDAAIDLLWSMYANPTFTAWTELWLAARTDPELAAAVVRIDEQSTADSRTISNFSRPTISVERRSGCTSVLFKGLAISRSIECYEPHPTEAVIDTFKTLIRPI